MNDLRLNQDAANADLATASNVAEQLASMQAADAVELLNELDVEDAVGILAEMPRDHAVLILDQPELHSSAEIITALPPVIARELLDAMSADRVTDIFQQFDDETRIRLAASLGQETKAARCGNSCITRPYGRQPDDDGIRQRSRQLERRCNASAHS